MSLERRELYFSVMHEHVKNLRDFITRTDDYFTWIRETTITNELPIRDLRDFERKLHDVVQATESFEDAVHKLREPSNT